MLHPIQRFFRQASRLLGCAILATAVAASPARAQLGGLVKKAKDAAVKKAADESGTTNMLEGEDVKYTDVLLKLTPERLDKVIKGLQISRDMLAKRPAMVDRRDAAQERIYQLTDKNSAALADLERKRQEVDNCRAEELGKVEDALGDNFGMRAMADPALRQKIQDISAKLAQAQMNGDTATIRAVSKEMETFTKPSAADTAKVDAKCGKSPPQSAVEKEIASLKGEVAQLNSDIQSMESGASKAAEQAAGMNSQQWGIAMDRIQQWMSAVNDNRKPRGLSSDELKALNDRRSDIAKAL